MAMSGIKVDPSVATFFKEVNLRKTHKFACFRLTENMKSVVVDKDMLGDAASTTTAEEDKVQFNKLKDMLVKEEPRYIIYDFGFEGNDGREVKKIAFIYWCSNDCPVRKKMIYTSTKDDVKKSFSGLGIEFQVNDFSDMDYEEMRVEVLKKAKH